jgi:MFS family permease
MIRRPTTFEAIVFQAAFGSYLMWAAGSAIPLIRIDFGISRTLASMHSISTGTGAVLGAHFALRLVKIISREKIMRLSIPIMATGLLGLTLGQSMWITVPSCSLAAFSQTLVNSISLAQISLDTKPSLRRIYIQSGIQACLGASAIFFISASLHANLGWRLPIIVGVLILAPLTLIVVWKVKFLVAEPTLNSELVTTKRGRSNNYYRILFVGFLMSFSEMGIGFWAIDLLISRGAGVALGALGLALLSLSMGISRIGYAVLNLPVKKTMKIVLVLYLVGIATICLVNSSTMTLIGLLITSIAGSALYGVGVFQVSEGFPDPASKISSFMTGTAASFGLTPLILALIFDNLGFIAGYLIMPVALFGAFFLWQSLGYKNDSQQNSTII